MGQEENDGMQIRNARKDSSQDPQYMIASIELPG
jgi:hypothetical protein